MAEEAYPQPTAQATNFIGRLKRGASTSDQRRTGSSSTAIADDVSPKEGPLTFACIITHGMGQQVPFETAASAAAVFVRGRVPNSVQANRVSLAPGSDLVARMELCYAATETEPETHVHIYEGYWAPLTEGKITYKAIAAFLLQTALAGLRVARSGRFDRWIFYGLYPLPVKRWTYTYLLVALSLLLLIFGFIALGSLALSHTWTMVRALGDGLACKGADCITHYLTKIFCNPLPFGSKAPCQWPSLLLDQCKQHWSVVLLILLLPFVILLGSKIRWFLIQYVGDVVIYVCSYKVSVYEEIRDAIQKTVFDLGKQVVAATDQDGEVFLYNGILFAGHSLGSVITYDLINALIVWDADVCKGRNVLLKRITRFVTFGSPLDKTAFLFRTQISKEEHHYRELMAGNMQPLVLDYAFRPFPWINLHSRRDPVSGSLAYYDLPQGIPMPPWANPVQNLIDPAARGWFGTAHVQYWDGMLLSDQLLAGVGLKRTA